MGGRKKKMPAPRLAVGQIAPIPWDVVDARNADQLLLEKLTRIDDQVSRMMRDHVGHTRFPDLVSIKAQVGRTEIFLRRGQRDRARVEEAELDRLIQTLGSEMLWPRFQHGSKMTGHGKSSDYLSRELVSALALLGADASATEVWRYLEKHQPDVIERFIDDVAQDTGKPDLAEQIATQRLANRLSRLRSK